MIDGLIGILIGGIVIVSTFFIGVFIHEKHNDPRVIAMAQIFWFLVGCGLMYFLIANWG